MKTTFGVVCSIKLSNITLVWICVMRGRPIVTDDFLEEWTRAYNNNLFLQKNSNPKTFMLG